MRRTLQFATLCVALCISGMGLARAETFNTADFRTKAVEALAAGDAHAALAMADALLTRDPQDFDAHLLRARAARELGQNADALSASETAWSLADTDLERHAAALVRAQALSSSDRRTAAQLWLRRAVQYAPDPAARARAIRDFRYVRARNPLSVDLRFGLAPRSNINNGSVHSSARLFDLPFEFQLSGAAQALSGFETSAGASLRYRISEAPTHATDLRFSLDSRNYTHSKEARALAPAARGSDYGQINLTAGFLHRWSDPTGRREWLVGADIGRLWYGGAPYADVARLTGGLNLALPNSQRLSIALTEERNRGPLAPSSDVSRVALGWSAPLPSGPMLSLSATFADSTSATSSADYRDLSLGLDIAPRRPFFGAEATFSLDLRGRDYPANPFAAGPRNDREVAASLSLALPKAEYLGFKPVLTLSARKNRSNVAIYETRDIGLSLGFRSAF